MDQALEGLKGVHCIADDILVVGSGATVSEAEVDHDQNLLALLHLCRQKGIKLNEKQLCLKRQDTTYMGHELTMNGVRPDPRKVDAILKMPPPGDKPAVRRLQGMATYLSRYCANFSELTAPLQELLHHENAFIWTDRQVEILMACSNMLSSARALRRADHAAAAGFSDTLPLPKFATGAPNADYL